MTQWLDACPNPRNCGGMLVKSEIRSRKSDEHGGGESGQFFRALQIAGPSPIIWISEFLRAFWLRTSDFPGLGMNRGQRYVFSATVFALSERGSATSATRREMECKWGVVKPGRVTRAGMLRVIDPRSVRADKATSLNRCARGRRRAVSRNGLERTVTVCNGTFFILNLDGCRGSSAVSAAWSVLAAAIPGNCRIDAAPFAFLNFGR